MAEYVKSLPNGPVRAELVEQLKQYPVSMLLDAVKDNPNHTTNDFVEREMYKIKELKLLRELKPEFWEEDEERHTLLPIKLKDIWAEYIKQRACFWTPGDVSFEKDDYDSLSDPHKRIMKYIMGFFSVADSIVNENIFTNLLKNMPTLEAKFMYMMQEAQENVHNEVYSKMVDAYIKDPEEKKAIFRAALDMKAIKRKVDWAKKWLNEADGLAQVIVAFLIVECLLFPVIFAIIYWMLSEKNLPLEGFFFSNEFIARDEGMHGDAGITVYNNYFPEETKLSQETVQSMIAEAIEADHEFVIEAFDGNKFPGMTPEMLMQYARFLGDQTLMQLNYEPMYNVDNPFRFMQNLGMDGRTDFFAKRVSEYRKDSPSGEEASTFDIISDDI
ncbi:ribonucleoside-diphosphate reductase small subunit-like [Littorina saxatilis]|uniref:Uncharacterized protein n=1 Tax=Littorina saxatilis TaxID=31220 RepID=A0AAN9B3E2_9CAEN